MVEISFCKEMETETNTDTETEIETDTETETETDAETESVGRWSILMREITQDENCHLGIRETTIVDLTMHGRFHR